MVEQVKIAVIGGSGLYNMAEITDKISITLETPYGRPSDALVIGTLSGKRVAFLPRHGVGHVYTPSTVPYRANIYALKTLGVRMILAVNACGSLREDYAPGHFVIPDQLYDNTKSERGGRSFFDSGLVGHVSVADPLCPALSDVVYRAAQNVADVIVHRGGIFVTIEGPRFSTRAESHAYRQLGFSIIGMTTCPEAFLAREAEIAYAVIAHVTDYDVWRETEESVTTEMVVQRVHENVDKVQQILAQAIGALDEDADYPSHHALDGAVMTAPHKMSAALLDTLKPILGQRFTRL